MATDPDEIIDIGNRLLTQHPDAFTTDFSTNTAVVRNLNNIGSNRLQTRIAGYITRKKRSS